MNRHTKVTLVVNGYEGRPILADLTIPTGNDSCPLVIFCHGFKGFKDWGHFNLMADYFAEKGFAFLKFNFSHNGGTIENPIDFPDLEAFSENTFWKEVRDVDAVIDAIHGENSFMKGKEEFDSAMSRINLSQINIVGHSRGGGIALISGARDNRIKKVVSWAGLSDFSSRLPRDEKLEFWKERGVVYVENQRTKQQMPMKFSFVESFFEHQKDLNILKGVHNMKKPVLVVHGTEDEVVLLSEAKAIVAESVNAQSLYLEGADHVFGSRHPCIGDTLPGETQKVIDRTISFLKYD